MQNILFPPFSITDVLILNSVLLHLKSRYVARQLSYVHFVLDCDVTAGPAEAFGVQILCNGVDLLWL